MTQKFNTHFSTYAVKSVKATIPNISGPLDGTNNRYEILPLFAFEIDAVNEQDATTRWQALIDDCSDFIHNSLGTFQGTKVLSAHIHQSDGSTSLEALV